jgi:hypothetical protein
MPSAAPERKNGDAENDSYVVATLCISPAE